MCLAIQERDGRPAAVLLYADEAGLLEEYPAVLDALTEWFSVRVLKSLEQVAMWRRPHASRIAGARARRLLAKMGYPPTVFVCNGQRPESYLLWKASGDRLAFEYVEDGLDAYLPSNVRSLSRWRLTLHRWIFGSPWPQGGTDLISALPFLGGHVLVPELARVGVGRGHLAIPTKCLAVAIDTLSSAVRPVGIDGRQEVNNMYLLQHSRRIANIPEYIAKLRQWAVAVRSSDLPGVPAVKAHPRETNAELLKELTTVGAVVFPHQVPVELISPSLLANITITCGLTTFIVSSRDLLPDRRIVLDDSVDPVYAAILQRWDPSISDLTG
jgi:hypothetical protein